LPERSDPTNGLRIACLTRRRRDEVIPLPLYPGMMDEEQDSVIEQIRRLAAARRTG